MKSRIVLTLFLLIWSTPVWAAYTYRVDVIDRTEQDEVRITTMILKDGVDMKPVVVQFNASDLLSLSNAQRKALFLTQLKEKAKSFLDSDTVVTTFQTFVGEAGNLP